MKTSQPVKVGLDALLTPDNCALILIDHQPFQVSAVRNIDVALMINNTVALPKAAKAASMAQIMLEHGGASSTNLAWELQLLGGRAGSGV